MNFLWINFDCCTLGNYLIASVVKVLVYGLIYIVPLVLITYSIIKFTKKKKEKKRTKKLIIGIVQHQQMYIVIVLVSQHM